jgi:predicted TIM-barrel fold metal-dependent hydrolase
LTTFDAYTAARRRLGTERTIVAQPTAHGVDNRVALDAVARLAN